MLMAWLFSFQKLHWRMKNQNNYKQYVLFDLGEMMGSEAMPKNHAITIYLNLLVNILQTDLPTKKAHLNSSTPWYS